MKVVGNLLIVLLFLFTASFVVAQNQDEVLSEVNGYKITRAELEQREGNHLHQPRYQAYQAEQQALDNIINYHLLEMEAQKQKITIDQLFDREVKSQLKDPTEDQLQVYYEGLNSKETYESVRGKILQKIRELRLVKAQTAYLEKLRAKASVLTMLAPPKAEINLKDSYRLGSEQAPLLLVEFADYECPYCQKAFPDLKKLRDEYGSQLSVVFKDLPLPMHSHAWKAAEAARCAGVQGKYWQFHDSLFSTGSLDVASLKRQARDIGLDSSRFDKCLDSGEQTAAVNKDYDEARNLGITGTPSYFLNGQYFSGAMDYATLKQMVTKELARRQQQLAAEGTKSPSAAVAQ